MLDQSHPRVAASRNPAIAPAGSTSDDATPDPASPERRLIQARQGAVMLWAAIGVGWVLFCAQAMIRWVASDEFGPTPYATDARMPTWSFYVMRSLEYISIALALWMIWVFLVKPLITERRLTLDGKIVIGSILTIVIDPMINYFHYTFAWNAQAMNLGTWHFTFPLSSDSVGTYGEGLAWAGPMYLYLGLGLSAIMIRIIQRMRTWKPAMSNVVTYGTATFVVFLLDCILEAIFLRAHVYAYPRTIKALTLFPGSEYQFPVYESVFVAFFALGFCCLRMSAAESTDGLSFAERGLERVRPSMRTVTSTLAVIGFSFVCAFLSYFATWSWMSVNVDSYNPKVPEYMWPVHATK